MGNTAGGNPIARVPISFPAANRLVVQADVKLTIGGTTGADVGFSTGTAGFATDGSLWVLFRRQGFWILRGPGNTTILYYGTIAPGWLLDQFNTVKLQYDSDSRTVCLWVNGNNLLDAYPLGFNPGLSYAGIEGTSSTPFAVADSAQFDNFKAWPAAWADADKDGDVDIVDFAVFQRCLNSGGQQCPCQGTPPALPGECFYFDHNGDGWVDPLLDLAAFIACANGPSVPVSSCP